MTPAAHTLRAAIMLLAFGAGYTIGQLWVGP